MSYVIDPMYNHYNNLPNVDELINPLLDIDINYREDNELTEFYKMCNEYYSPELGAKYLLGMNLYPYQMAVIRTILAHKFPLLLLSRGAGKTLLLAVYAVLHAILYPGARIILVSASGRQAKLIFAEIERMYHKSSLLRQIASKKPTHLPDASRFELMGSSITALPLGQGNKIRGERGHVILCDEFDAVPIEIFDIVIRGFGATQADPFIKTREYMLDQVNKNQKKLGVKRDKAMEEFMLSDGNKLVLSGTAGWRGGTFYKMYSQYSKIISNKMAGKMKDYAEIFSTEEIHDDDYKVDCSDYAIVKMGYKDLPVCMLDIKSINNARATMPSELFSMEYEAIFGDDTMGFFKERHIRCATVKRNDVDAFSAKSRGQSSSFIMAVDPARAHDRFAIVIIELSTPNKVVYCWTSHKQSYKKSVIKMRQLMRNFNIVGIGIDEGGGGLAVEEILNMQDLLEGKDVKVYRIDDESMEAQAGHKILHMFNFSSANWLDEANTLLQKNIEDCSIRFPVPVIYESGLTGKQADDIEDILVEIGEMKKEVVSIEVIHTRTGRKSFDLAPPDPRKDVDGRVKHKDRYSALLIGNYLSFKFDKINHDEKRVIRDVYDQSCRAGGFIEDIGS